MIDKISNCCYALVVEGTEVIENWGWCGDCKEMSEFKEEKEE